ILLVVAMQALALGLGGLFAATAVLRHRLLAQRAAVEALIGDGAHVVGLAPARRSTLTRKRRDLLVLVPLLRTVLVGPRLDSRVPLSVLQWMPVLAIVFFVYVVFRYVRGSPGRGRLLAFTDDRRVALVRTGRGRVPIGLVGVETLDAWVPRTRGMTI